MKFCKECGQQMASDKTFCPNCGAQVATPVQAEPMQSRGAVKETQPRKKMSIIKKLGFITFFIVVAGLVGTYFFLDNQYDEESKVSAFYNTIVNQDQDGFYTYLTMKENTLYEPESYLSYVENQDHEELLEDLKKHARQISSDGITRVVKHQDGTDLFKMTTEKKYFLFNDLHIEPFYSDLVVESDFEELQFTFAGETVDIPKGKTTFSNIITGDYPAVFKAANGEELTTTITVLPKEDVLFSLNRSDYMVSIESDQPEAILFINGESSGKTVKEMTEIGPYFGENEIELHLSYKKEDGKEQLSNAATVSPGESIKLTFAEDKEAAISEPTESLVIKPADVEEAKDNFYAFRESYEVALNYEDFSTVSPYLLIGSSAYNDTAEFIGDIGDDYYYYEFSHDEVLSAYIEGSVIKVDTYEEFYFTNHLDDTIFYQRTKTYTFERNSGSWLISKIDIDSTETSQ